MNQERIQTNLQNDSISSGVRITLETKNRAMALLKEANKKNRGRKVKLNDLFSFSLGLVTESHLKELQRSSWTKHDEMELWHSIYIRTRGQISKDEFLGFMMTSEWAGFMKEHKKEFDGAQ